MECPGSGVKTEAARWGTRSEMTAGIPFGIGDYDSEKRKGTYDTAYHHNSFGRHGLLHLSFFKIGAEGRRRL